MTAQVTNMKLSIVGTGILRPQHLTMETIALLQRARRVLHLTATPSGTADMLATLGVKSSRGLDDLYEPGDIDDVNYQRVIAAVEAELPEHQDVALLLYGHPRFGVTLTASLEQRLRERVAVRVYSGISSFDTMINDLARDPLSRGSVLLDANRMLLFKMALNPALDHYIFHAGSVATRHTLGAAQSFGHLDLLKAHLLRYYSERHEIQLVVSAVLPADGCLRALPLKDLERGLSLLEDGATLFIPAQRPTSIDQEVLNHLRGDL